jgi:hypothetical protein
MFRRARGTIREVEPEIISPAEQTPFVVQLLASGQLPHVRIEPAPPIEVESIAPRQETLRSVEVEEPEEIELAPLIEIEAAVTREEALPQVEADQPEERDVPKLEPPKAKRPRAKRSRPAERAASSSSAPARAVEETRAPEREVPALDDLTCEVLFWRGYRMATFYARIFSDEGEPLAVAQSPSFRAQGNGTPDKTEEAVAAYRALREQLEQTGWERAGSGKAWFADVYSRPV